VLRLRQFSLFINKGNCLIFFLLILAFTSNAQNVRVDTTGAVKVDTTTAMKQPPKTHPPKRAALFSAVLPGAGQVYNHKYWKVPILYAGFGGLGYLFVQNQQQFAYYRDILKARHDTTITFNDPLPNQSDQQIYTYREDFRRYRDLCFIGLFAVYVLNVVDASVDAHMFTFDVSEDLTLNMAPYYVPAYHPSMGSNISGLSLTLKF
jgi:hypothetical protein